MPKTRHSIANPVFCAVDRPDLQFLTPRKSQHALRQRRAAADALHRVFHQRGRSGIFGKPLPQKVEAALDRHQQIVEIMGDAAGQVSERFHALAVTQALFRLQ